MANDRPLTPRLQAARTVDYEARRKERAMALMAAKAIPKPELPAEIPSPEKQPAEYIEYQRMLAAKAKAPVESLAQQIFRAKRTRETAFIPRKERAERIAVGREAQEQLEEIKKQEAQFEIQIAQSQPEYAKPEYKAQALNKAQSDIQTKANSLIEKIQRYEQKIKDHEAWWRSKPSKYRQDESNRQSYRERIDDYEDDIDIAKTELNEYQRALKDNENTLIKRFYSGYTYEKADYEAERRKAQIEGRKAFEKAKVTDPELQTVIKELNLPANVSIGQMQQAIGKYESEAAYLQQLFAWGEKVGFEKLPEFAKTKLISAGAIRYKDQQQLKEQGIKQIYDKPLDAWFDPISGKPIYQSMREDVAKAKGYIPIKVTGETLKGGYIVESKTGLLTPEQLKIRELFEKSPKLAQALYPGLKLEEIPTTFVLGGPDIRTGLQKFQDIISMPKSPYEVAARRPAYKTEDLKAIEEYREYGKPISSRDIGSNITIPGSNITANTTLSNLSQGQEPSIIRGGLKTAWLQEGFKQEQIAYADSGINRFLDRFFGNQEKKREEARNYLASDKFRQEAMRGLGDPDIRKYYAKVAIPILVAISPGLSASTKLALGLQGDNLLTLIDPAKTDKTKVAALSEIAISLGTAALSSMALGAAAKFTEDAAIATGMRILSKVLARGGSTGSTIARNIAGLSLVGLGKATKFGVETYFKYGIIQSAIEATKLAQKQEWRGFSLSAAEIAGGFPGFYIGRRFGKKLFDVSSFLTGKAIAATPELYKGRITIKKMPSAIQAQILTEQKNLETKKRIGISAKEDYDIYYHGTSKFNAEKILLEGFKTKGITRSGYTPFDVEKGTIWLTKNRILAASYGGKGGRIIEVRLPKKFRGVREDGMIKIKGKLDKKYIFGSQEYGWTIDGSDLPILKRRQPTLKKNIIELTISKPSEVYIYRRGPLAVGQTYMPRLDKYLSGRIKTPTKQVFFRFEETRGVKGQKISPALSIPSFVQPPRYTDMFLANLKQAKGTRFNRLLDAFAKTPVMTDILSVARYKAKPIPNWLREQMIKEFATTGKLSKSTQKSLLKVDSTISDKLRELEFQEEQEAAIRGLLKLKNTKLGFTRSPDGRLLPVIYEKGTLKPRTSILQKKKIITQQDAKYIQRQYDMWAKFKEDYVLPKEHSVRHAKAVSDNVAKIVKVYPEFHPYLIKKYGSLDKAIFKIQQAAKFHDIGKVSESSAEFGTPHGEKFYNVWKAKLLPKEAQDLPKSIAKAIKTHETLAGTKLGRYTLRYQLQNIAGSITPEQKILATADRLDLVRYGIEPISRRLPLGDVLERLNIKPEVFVKKSPEPKIKEKYPMEVPYEMAKYNPLKYILSPTYVPTKYVREPYKVPKKPYEPYKATYKPREYPLLRIPYKPYPRPKKPYIPPKKPYVTPTYLIPTPPPYVPPIPRKKVPPKPILPILIPEARRRPLPKIIKKRPTYVTLPTAFEQLVAPVGKRPKARPIRRVTGFEIFRFK